jgi:hypothetical protein
MRVVWSSLCDLEEAEEKEEVATETQKRCLTLMKKKPGIERSTALLCAFSFFFFD